MRRFPHAMLTAGIVFLLTAVSGAQAPQPAAQQTPLERYFTQSLKNLQVIPKGTPRPEVIHIMDGFVQGLGVVCTSCHVLLSGQSGGCPPTPDGEATCDFASDTMRTKQVARQMMLMMQDINTKVPAATKKPAATTTSVQCVTCHRGVAIPKQVNEILAQTASEKGIQAAMEQFRDLRKRYYGAQSYDFSEGNLIALARPSIAAPPGTPPSTPPAEHKLDEALSWLQLNLEYYPKSARTYLALAQGYQRKNDKDAAIKSLEKALEIEPDNAGAKRQLEQLTKP